MASEPKLTGLGKLTVLLFVAGCLAGGIYLFISGGKDRPGGPTDPSNSAAPETADSEMITVGIAYGTEKKRWILWAAEAFKKTEAGKNISLDLIPMGSLEGAHAVLDSDKRIHVWSPASAVYKDVFVQDWQVRHGGNPILSEEPLALSPMVFITWRNRLTAFEQALGPMNLDNIRKAILTQGGWGGIAQKPE